MFYKHYDSVLKRILDRPGVLCRVACLEEGPDVILGYAILERNEDRKDHCILHWAYTKPLWRKIGIHTDLLHPYKIKYVTHLTHFYEQFRPERFQFNPFLI